VVDSSGDTEAGFTLAWRVRAHKLRIAALAVYTPRLSHALDAIDNDYPDYLDDPLVVSGGRDGHIRIASINTGHEEVSQIRAHDDQINSIAIFSGYKSSGAHMLICTVFLSQSPTFLLSFYPNPLYPYTPIYLIVCYPFYPNLLYLYLYYMLYVFYCLLYTIHYTLRRPGAAILRDGE
jgi:hypothetical protein